MEPSFVHNIDDDHAQKGSQQGISVLHTGSQVFPIHFFWKRAEFHIEQKAHGECSHEAQHPGDIFPIFLIKKRTKCKNKNDANYHGNTHVHRGMNPQIHPGKGYQCGNRNTQYLHPTIPGGIGNAAIGSHGALGVSTGKAITVSPCPGLLHNGKLRVLHPGPGNTAVQFEELVENRTHKPNRHEVIPSGFIHAPEENQCNGQKNDFTSQIGNSQHNSIEPACPYLFQQS